MPTSDALIAEEWREIPGWPEYCVSSQGRVLRPARYTSDGKYLRERYVAVTLSVRKGGYKYLAVNLGGRSYRETHSVGRLVLLAFVGPCPEGEQCRHLNDDSTDCSLLNLAWGTPQQNAEDMVRNGKTAKGENHGRVKLTDDEVRLIREMYKPGVLGFGCRTLSKRFNINRGVIMKIVTRQIWRHI